MAHRNRVYGKFSNFRMKERWNVKSVIRPLSEFKVISSRPYEHKLCLLLDLLIYYFTLFVYVVKGLITFHCLIIIIIIIICCAQQMQLTMRHNVCMLR